jgi:hypothetical protein
MFVLLEAVTTACSQLRAVFVDSGLALRAPE